MPEQPLTFTNHRVWRGRKDRSRLAAGLSQAAGTAQQVPSTASPSTQQCQQLPSRGAGQGVPMEQPPALAGILGRVS